PGVQATREAVEEVLGLKLNYFAMVDMQGFVSLVDAVGGVRIDLNKRTPIGGGPNGGYLWIEPKKDLLMDGNLALGIARSRYQSSDYERMVRQRCVLNGMLNQLDPFTVATKFGQLASATEKGLVTDVPSSEINRLAELALKTRQLDTTSVSFTPPLIYPGTPNWALIRQTVKDTIAASEALDTPTPTPSRTTAAASSSKPASSSTSRSTTPTRTTAAPTSTRSSSRPASSAAPTVDPSENAPIDPTTICVAR
ncbi:MAG TPA: LCP family protein, partial [Propionibacteriaceae bacterium]|nr:LCP family protein [Propionibacteriaceae bacterium]